MVQFKMHIPERNNMLPPQKKHKILGESNCVGREVQNVYENLPKRGGSHVRAEFTLILSQIGYLQG